MITLSQVMPMTRIMTNGAVEVVLTITKAAGGSTIVINPT